MSAHRYRKIFTKIWADEKFASLTPIAPSGQALWIYLLTGPHTGPIPGLFTASQADLCARLDWPPEAFQKAFQEVIDYGMAKAFWRANFVYVPNAIKYAKPASPNVVKSWSQAWEDLPECDLKREAYEALKASIYALGEAYAKAFDTAIEKPSPKPLKPSRKTPRKAYGNQEQDLKDKPPTTFPVGKVVPPLPDEPDKKRKAKTAIPSDFGISERVERWAAERGFDNLVEHLEAFVRKCKAKGYTYADWDAAFMEAVREDWAKLRTPPRASPPGRLERQKQVLDELTGRSRSHDQNDPFTLDVPARIVR
ncbi:MAG: hypothetical protein ACREYA_32415 [Cupriavidus necator]